MVPAQTLLDIARGFHAVPPPASKPHSFYEIYEGYFAPLRDEAIAFLEIGVYEAESTRVFSRYFRNGRIVGIDTNPAALDPVDFPNVVLERGSQTDAGDIERVAGHAPQGFDVVVDDASHIGYFSWLSLNHLYHRLKPGGFYILEDWRTGFDPGWTDGTAAMPLELDFPEDGIPRTIPSHTAGMVGYLKLLLDSFEAGRIGAVQVVPKGPAFEFVHVYRGTAVLKKAPSPQPSPAGI